jgi:putative ABC transport system permease protein
MLRTTLKGFAAHKLRLLTTGLAVMLGVAFLAGTLVLTDTLGHTFNNVFADVYKGTDAMVRARAAFEGAQNTGEQRGRVDASLVDQVRRVPGVAEAQGDVFGYARIIGKDGEALGNPAAGAPTLGSNWSTSSELNPFTLDAGRPPAADDEVVIDRKSARDGSLSVGDVTTVLVQGGPQRVTVVGIARFGNADSPGGASFAMFTTPAAQRLIAEPGKFDNVSVVADEGLPQQEIVRRIAAILPNGIEAVTGATVTREAQDQVRSAMSFFNTFMLVFAIVALLVGSFMIFNTFSITVAQRTKENALLRALGASRRQVLASVLGEAVIVGLLASLAGLGIGVLVAGGLKAMINALGFGIPGGSIVFATRTVLISLGAGLFVTLLAATSPARKAAKVPPVAAMHEIGTGSTGYGSKERIMVGTAVLALGVAVLLYGLLASPAHAVLVVGVGALAVFFGVSVLGRTVSLPMSRVIGLPIARSRGAAGLLARENAMRNPKRTAASASALMIGVALVAFITILASSTKASINATLDRAFTGDLIVDAGGGMTGGVDPKLGDHIANLPEVESATAVRMGMALVDGKVSQVLGVDAATAFGIVDVKPLTGSPQDLGRDGIAIYKDVARDAHLRIGDAVTMRFKDSGEQQLRVALIYGEHRPAGDYFMGMDTYEANFANRLDYQIYVKKAPGVTIQQATTAIEQLTDAYPGTHVWDQAGIKAEQAKQINQLLALVYALLALAIVIALLGIGNTLALAIFERTRELGLLRAVGMTRSQLRSTIRWESVIIALQGTVLGLLIGVFFGWAMVLALADQGIDRFRVPLVGLAAVVMLGALAGVAAAILPGRRAAKLNVLRAIVAE